MSRSNVSLIHHFIPTKPAWEEFAAHLNELVDAFNDQAQANSGGEPGTDERDIDMTEHFLAILDATGKSPNYTDARYWLRPAYCSNVAGENQDAVLKTAKLTATYDLLQFTATNLAEFVTGGGTHLLTDGATAMVFAQMDHQGITHFVFTQATPQSGVRARIKVIAADYLTVVRYPFGVETGAQFNVAKNFKMRHVLANFPGMTSLITVDAQTVTVSDGTNTETWITIPSLHVNDEVRVVSVADGTGVTVDAMELIYEDKNRDGRAWRRQ